MFPKLTTRFANRHVLIVVRGEGYKDDLALLHDYLLDTRPVLLAVDGGADALLEARLKPDVILGDMDSVSDSALRCGAELIVHGYAQGDRRGAPGLERIEALGLKAAVFPSPGTSEDVAMLLADELGSLPYRRGRHPLLSGGVSRQRAGRHGQHLPDPPADRLQLADAKGIARRGPASAHACVSSASFRGGDTHRRGTVPLPDRADPAANRGSLASVSGYAATGIFEKPSHSEERSCRRDADMKYHVVTIAAIFFALTVGLVVGSLIVSPRVADRQQRAIARLQATLNQDNISLRQKLKRWEDFGGRISPVLLKGRLAGTSVAVIQTGDYPEALARVREALQLADVRIPVALTIGRAYDRPDDVLNPTLAALHTSNPLLPADRAAVAELIAVALEQGQAKPEDLFAHLEEAQIFHAELDNTQLNSDPDRGAGRGQPHGERYPACAGGSAADRGAAAARHDCHHVRAPGRRCL